MGNVEDKQDRVELLTEISREIKSPNPKTFNQLSQKTREKIKDIVPFIIWEKQGLKAIRNYLQQSFPKGFLEKFHPNLLEN